MSSHESDRVERAIAHGIYVYRCELEDEDSHPDDALRVALGAAVELALKDDLGASDERR